ncbi:unnamed protein product [Phyllotreta striolata]|uniref:Uncharacterized protein n=1 Tax=Phyllotreta striolata TaxID=444603 RepID=A0A9N9TIY4_PHYSR|nr:unnamed protein product [Phyllotreta striolata]
MKTYSRKKTDCLEPDSEEVIIDLNEICRLCMSKEDELVPIYQEEDAVPITLKIMACVALEVFEGDGLPDKICRPCKYQLEKSYHFRKKCEGTDLKLRLHLRDLPEDECDEEINTSNDSTNEDSQSAEVKETECEPSTEQDLVGVTKVAYIQQEQEIEQDPENITLPKENDEEDKVACTLSGDLLKTDEEIEEEIIYDIEEDQSSSLDDTNMDVIADAVKATLTNQTGLNLQGQVQMKLNQSEGKSTQVEVTTEDGSVIVMELLTEEDAEAVRPDVAPIVNADGELNIFQCPNCPKSFNRRIQLKRHSSVHMQQRGFSCGICEKWFPTRSALTRHERIHTGERPFQCEVCQKSFTQKEILFRHLMTHSGAKPFMCPHCEMGFSQKESFRVHLRTHTTTTATPTDIQLHYCSLCPKVFCHASGLSRHLVTHTGKTFKCRVCDKSFTDKSCLRRHYYQTNHQ